MPEPPFRAACSEMEAEQGSLSWRPALMHGICRCLMGSLRVMPVFRAPMCLGCVSDLSLRKAGAPAALGSSDADLSLHGFPLSSCSVETNVKTLNVRKMHLWAFYLFMINAPYNSKEQNVRKLTICMDSIKLDKCKWKQIGNQWKELHMVANYWKHLRQGNCWTLNLALDFLACKVKREM